jgi:hypothetical protein
MDGELNGAKEHTRDWESSLRLEEDARRRTPWKRIWRCPVRVRQQRSGTSSWMRTKRQASRSVDWPRSKVKRLR